ncbi:MAG: putative 2-aminoethylphosphonate ABC transporter ATP-binding protein [Microcoleaceae cyanobacterium]
MTYSSEQPVKTARQQAHHGYSTSDRFTQSPNESIGSSLGEPYLQIEGVNKSFGNFVALREIYLNVYPSEFVCLLGPSGCGKTTLLRIIAGLEQQTSGRVIQAGKDVSQLPPSKRDFGIVFQSYALFPNLTVEQNIGYGLQNEGRPKQEIQAKVSELISLVGLEGNSHKFPSQMSGGQQQRVALARALAQSPGLLLLDEPLSALDAKVREKLRTEITQLQKRLGITTVMVTHDQAEALSMADRVVVMDKGYIAQVGTPHNVYQEPNTPFVANFIGVMNFLKGTVISSDQVRCGNVVLNVSPRVLQEINSTVNIAVRPEDIKLLGEVDTVNSQQLNLPNVLIVNVDSTEFLGSSYLIVVSPEGDSKDKISVNIPIEIARQLSLNSLDCCLAVQLPPELIKVFPNN